MRTAWGAHRCTQTEGALPQLAYMIFMDFQVLRTGFPGLALRARMPVSASLKTEKRNGKTASIQRQGLGRCAVLRSKALDRLLVRESGSRITTVSFAGGHRMSGPTHFFRLEESVFDLYESPPPPAWGRSAPWALKWHLCGGRGRLFRTVGRRALCFLRSGVPFPCRGCLCLGSGLLLCRASGCRSVAPRAVRAPARVPDSPIEAHWYDGLRRSASSSSVVLCGEVDPS